jgi:hypothetical protein
MKLYGRYILMENNQRLEYPVFPDTMEINKTQITFLSKLRE